MGDATSKLLVLCILAGVLIYTNPTMNDYKLFAEEQFSAYIKNQGRNVAQERAGSGDYIGALVMQGMAAFLGESTKEAASEIIATNTTREDFFLGSRYFTHLDADTRIVTVGMLGKFLILEAPAEMKAPMASQPRTAIRDSTAEKSRQETNSPQEVRVGLPNLRTDTADTPDGPTQESSLGQVREHTEVNPGIRAPAPSNAPDEVSHPPSAATAERRLPEGAIAVRSGPGVNFSVIRTLSTADAVTIHHTYNGWSFIGDGWVPSEMFNQGPRLADSQTRNAPSVQMRVIASNELNVREGPGPEYSTVRKIGYNDIVSVYRSESGWSFIGDGWVNSRYLSDATRPTPPSSILTGTTPERKKKTESLPDSIATRPLPAKTKEGAENIFLDQ